MSLSFLALTGATGTADDPERATFRDPILVHDVDCSGDESSIFDCAFGVTTTGCRHFRDDVFLTCLPYGTLLTSLRVPWLIHVSGTIGYALHSEMIATRLHVYPHDVSRY